MAYFYDVEVEWLKEREGELHAANLPTITVGAPPEFKGREGIWTPEHLYVAAVNSCFMATFLAIATASKLEFNHFHSQAQGKLDKLADAGYQMTEITLKPKLVIPHAHDIERAGRILEKAEKSCLISNSIKTVVKLEVEISTHE